MLRQKIQMPGWGTSLPGAKETVSFDGKSAAATADAVGRWRLMLEPLTAVPLKSVNDAPQGKTMTVVCGKDGEESTKEIRNLLVGDVWLCAGQSNMAGSRHKVEGKIDGSQLLVSAEGVEKPAAVRYAYIFQPMGHLVYNTEGMPVSPFST